MRPTLSGCQIPSSLDRTRNDPTLVYSPTTVPRGRAGVQTQQIGLISDISENDCQVFEAGMTKCSKWLPGHDQAAAVNEDIPDPDEMKEDIESLENWVREIRQRR